MNIRSAALGTTLLAAATLASPAANAAALTTSFATFQATLAGQPVTNTVTTGLFDPFALNLPMTSVLPLADGNTLTLSTPAQVTQPQNGFPYLLTDNFAGDLLIPVDANGNQLKSETILLGSVSALGFELVPFSSSLGGPYTVTATLSSGQTLSATLAGANLNAGATTPAFFGYTGGGISALTISTSDPNGFAVGNFFDVPEPTSLALLLSAALGLGLLPRRRT